MKIAYVLSADPFEENGINKKVRSQVSVWRCFGNEVEVFSILVNKGKRRNINYLQARIYKRHKIFFLPKSFFNDITNFKPDIVYLRFEILKPFHWRILKNYISILEINSDDMVELNQLAKKNVRNKIRLIYNLLARELLFYKVSAVISITNELLTLPYMNRFNKPEIVIPNSLCLDEFVIKKRKNNYKIPQLIFLGSSDYEWHGIDKIISLAKQTEGRLFFHIIGPDAKDLPVLSNVKYYGYLLKEEYEKVIENCDIGISTLALHRKNMNEANSIKLREYLAYGLPSIVGYLDTAFENKGYPDWILQLENNEGNIINNVQKIVDFCYKYKDVILKKSDVYDFIDSHSIEEKKLVFFDQIVKGLVC